MARCKISIAREVINLPSSHKNSLFSNPSFRGTTGRFEGKGKLLFKGAQTMKCTLWTETLKFWRLKVANSAVSTSRFSSSLIRGWCAIFISNSRFMRLFQVALNTSLDSPLVCQPLSSRFALHGLHTLEFSRENDPSKGNLSLWWIIHPIFPWRGEFLPQLREAKPGGLQTGGFPTFFGKGRGPVRDCSS